MKKNKVSRNLDKYLTHYAEKEVGKLSEDISNKLYTKPFDNCLIIPAYNETHDFIERLISKLDNNTWSSTLIIIVVNQPDNDHKTQENQALWSTFKTLILQTSHTIPDEATGTQAFIDNSTHTTKFKDKLPTNHTLTFNHIQSQSSIVFVDFFTGERKLPCKKGVGLARKIGCDLACHLTHNNKLASKWLHTSDADTRLPDDYFHQTNAIKSPAISAAVYDFMHFGEDNIVTHSTILYEHSLYYYVDGLRFARSSYAYHTLGSCIAINTTSYILVRGFTRRAGGEDFYCLNKLAKIGNIKELKGNKLKILARNSNRVPFGTGPAVEKIVEKSESITSLMAYNPVIFLLLKKLLLSFENLFDHRGNTNEWLTIQSSEVRFALESIHITLLFSHISSQIKDRASCISHIHQWFDAFKTLKFIHALEEHYPKVTLDDAKIQLKKYLDKE